MDSHLPRLLWYFRTPIRFGDLRRVISFAYIFYPSTSTGSLSTEDTSMKKARLSIDYTDEAWGNWQIKWYFHTLYRDICDWRVFGDDESHMHTYLCTFELARFTQIIVSCLKSNITIFFDFFFFYSSVSLRKRYNHIIIIGTGDTMRLLSLSVVCVTRANAQTVVDRVDQLDLLWCTFERLTQKTFNVDHSTNSMNNLWTEM